MNIYKLRSKIKPFASLAIILFTVTIFVLFYRSHPEIKHQLSQLSIYKFSLLIFLYAISFVSISLVNTATLKLCQIKPIKRELFLLTAYSAVINFFGPLQSGPAARAIYLKKRYDLSLKKYSLATLFYYFFWALFSIIFLLSGILNWLILPLVLLSLLTVIIVFKTNKFKSKFKDLEINNWYLIGLATLLQVFINSLIYFVELTIVAPSIHFNQAIIYSGAANLALFVSLTPGAIGFRESFLVLSHKLHHLSNTVIVSANIIDRSVYIVILLILSVIIVLTHAAKRLGLTKQIKKI
ncbi:MAG TPA: hypothetical protein VLF63_00505 [Patescibacteria group bacterium]|nr:hypothetical protein [Patescibacteria group bacterium]